MARAAGAQPLTDHVDQLRQEEKVILKKRVRRHVPADGRNAKHYFQSPFGRRLRPHKLDLLVKCRLGNGASLDINHQPIVRSNKTDVQSLLEFVPLAPNHNTIAVAIRLRTWNNWRDQGRIHTTE